MCKLKSAAKAFLKSKIIAVAGVSSKGDTAANIIFKKLRENKLNVYPVNPNSEKVEGTRCYPTMSSIPETVESVVIGTHPDVTPVIVDECIDLNIKNIWVHQSIGLGSYNETAIQKAKRSGIRIIPGGCPMMFLEPVDPAHKCMRWFFSFTGKEPDPIGFGEKA